MTKQERSNQVMTMGECERIHEERDRVEDERHASSVKQFAALGEAIKDVASEMKTSRTWMARAACGLAITIIGGLVGMNFVGGIPNGDKFDILVSKVDTNCQKVADLEKRADMNFQRVSKHDEFISAMQNFLKKDSGSPGALGRFGKVEQRREDGKAAAK